MCPFYRKWSACPGHSERLWDSGRPWCTRAGISGYEKHCETFTHTHRESFPTCACGWVGSHSNVCCAWSVYFIAISPRGEFVLGIDRCLSWEINSTLFSTPKPLLTNFSEYTPSLPGQGIHQPWHKWLLKMAFIRAPSCGGMSGVSQEAAALTVLSQPWEAWREGGCPHLTIVAGSSWACLFISVLWCHVIGLFYPFHSHATQSWVWVVLKNKIKGGKTAWEWMKSLPPFPHEQTNTKTFLFLTFKNYNWEMETQQKSLLATAGGFMVLKRYMMWLKWNHS